MVLEKKHHARVLSGVSAALIVMAGVGIPAASAAAATPGSTILDSWEDAKGRQVFVREGAYNATSGKGFGMKKIRERHNIHKITSLKFATGNPNGGTAEGLHRRYDAYANRIECVNGKCEYTDSIPIRVIMNNEERDEYYGVNLRDQKIGVMTAYCISDTKATDCPSWVDKALANPTDFRASRLDASASPADGESYTASYEPLAGTAIEPNVSSPAK
ncbi:hypothetical protein [Curtobacterium sp. PsM8]|uniref:hypothetical protein n=1 Tax=Curtobacterium sp. PsM8 TaxID=3030532 RepID=UPI00263B78B4|nr:hypothetical protein [Curtobacterium sp. PsM8]MDN4646806.1 hypothetical protein [Curtobacterium sp. PsM8]